MKSDKLLDAMEHISDDKILDAKHGKVKNKVNWTKIISIAACVACIVAGSVKGFTYFASQNGADGQTEGAAENLTAGDACDELPGGLVPTISYNGKVYYWTGLSDIPDYFEKAADTEASAGKTETANLEMKAGFEAEGNIYANAEYPEVIYVEMTTDWLTNEIVRFVTKELGDCERIAYQNKQYRMEYASGTQEYVENLPEESVLIGKLHFIGRDSIPQNDLETNVPNDRHNVESMEGREVFACPEDTSKIYVTIHDYHKDDMSIKYQVCYLWEE